MESQIQPTKRHLKGAAGKAFIVYLGTGSVVVAAIAYFLFSGMGC